MSVIVPAYNAAVTIGETLESALAQTHRDLEVLVVDDGSTDATAEVVCSFAARDPRVRLLRQANAGVAAARNLAIAHARGAYVAPLDADDLWHPEKIALQVAAMRRAGPRVAVVHCWRRVIDMENRVLGEELPYPHEGDVYVAAVLGNVPGNGSVPLLRRTCLIEVGGYDPGLRARDAQGCEDFKLYLSLAERYDFIVAPWYLVGYRRTPGSMASDPRRLLRSAKLVLAEARQRHPELPGWLFRLAEARWEYWQAKSCLRRGILIPGLAMFARGLVGDPVAAVYRLAEGSYRLRSWSVLKALISRLMLPSGGRDDARPVARSAAWPLDCSPEAQGKRADAMSCVPDAIRGRPFLALAPEPTLGPKLGSSLYTWRCRALAASVVTQRRDSPAVDVACGNAPGEVSRVATLR